MNTLPYCIGFKMNFTIDPCVQQTSCEIYMHSRLSSILFVCTVVLYLSH